MMTYELRLARSARKELETLPTTVLARLARALDAFPQNPRPPGCKKLRGTTDLWRVRVGDYRIIYEIDDTARVITVRAIRVRKDAYD
jgi:mRNA interferase RelE/StbE